MRWETLNAYVDGELASDERRAVAEAARQDPAVAAQLATLSRLKQTVRGAVATQGPVPRGPARVKVAGWACAALAVLIGASLLIRSSSAPDADPVFTAYQAWASRASATDAVHSLSTGAGFEAAPDLRAAGFGLSYVSERATGGGRLIGYQGRHGCRLALWLGPVSEAAGLSDPPPSLRIARWVFGERRFVALSEGMDAERFARLVAALEQLVRPPEPERVRVALARAAGAADRPCAS
ncbi:anti-sigma factor [Methylobacterium sp. DB1607]|nr:anti-sigma factor [Methylobacterium sp. DB1607]